MKNLVKSNSLSPAQIMVLQVVKEQYDEQDLEDLRELLLDFNHRKMQQHLDRTIDQKKYTTADFDKMLDAHLRKTS